MKYVLSICAMVLAFSCTNRDHSSDTNKKEVVEAPGQVGKTTQEKSHMTVEGTKKTITTDTDHVKESVPSVGYTQQRADINRMGNDDFVALGLPKDQAEKVTDWRSKHGDFKSVDDLRQIPGFNTSWLDKMKDKLAVSTG